MNSNAQTGYQRQDAPRLQATLAELKEAFGDACSTSRAAREQHASAMTGWHELQIPDVVVTPTSTEQVSAAVTICARNKIPIIPFGTGTSIEGGVNAPFGGVSIDLGGMSDILTVNEEDMDCRVQAGVTRKQLNEYVKSYGLFFPVDPGADASLGGMASTRASGTTTVRYGTMRENTLALTVVMADGSVRKTGNRARKSAAGYDITKLFIGAEGTLGVITELTVKLHGIPQSILSATCSFPNLESAANAVISAIRYGIPMARIELLDELQVRACNNYSKLGLPERPTLFLEFHGTDAGTREQTEMFGDISRDLGGSGFAWAERPEDRNRLWRARHDVYWACLTLRPGAKYMATDSCVPISRLAEFIVETREDIDRTGLISPIIGHVGDGNVHTSILVDTTDANEVAKIKDFLGRLAERAIAMDGTCTGEHGIGQGKQQYLVREHGSNVETMRSIKSALDPQNIMNPGKIFLPV